MLPRPKQLLAYILVSPNFYGMTQAEAGEVLGLSQAMISYLLKRLKDTDEFFLCGEALGYDKNGTVRYSPEMDGKIVRKF